MIQAAYAWFEARAQPRNLVLAGLAWALLGAGIVALQSNLAAITGGLAVPDLEPLYSPERFYALLEAYGERGRSAYLAFTVFDVLYPLAAYAFYGLLLAALIGRVGRGRLAARALILVPVAGLLVELLEQGAFLGLLAAFPRRLGALAWSASVLTFAKYALLVSLALAIAGLACTALWQWLRRPAS